MFKNMLESDRPQMTI